MVNNKQSGMLWGFALIGNECQVDTVNSSPKVRNLFLLGNSLNLSLAANGLGFLSSDAVWLCQHGSILHLCHSIVRRHKSISHLT